MSARHFEMLDEDDKQAVLTGILGSAGPEGMDENEVIRQASKVAKWVIEAQIQAILLDQMRSGVVRVTARPDGEVVFTRTVAELFNS